MRQLTENLILKLHVKQKFMVFNLVLRNDYLSVATISEARLLTSKIRYFKTKNFAVYN